MIASSTFALVVLALMGEAARRIVGILYLHPEKRQVKVAHLTFLGKREDFVLPLSDVVPLSETPENPRAVFWAMHLYDASAPRRLVSTAFGGVKHRRYLVEIFGEEALLAAKYREDDDDGEL